MTGDTRTAVAAQPRVATRQGVGGHAEERRRRFQRHLLLFLFVNLAIAGADHLVLPPPGVQWAQWIIIPWLFVFLLHVLGLKSRGFPWVELVTPPKRPVIKEVYSEPLEYEVVRARQLRDGISNAAASVRASHPEVADAALTAADALLDALEELFAATREHGQSSGGAERADDPAEQAQAALEALNDLHENLIRVEVLDASPDVVDIERVRQRAEAIRPLSA